MTECPRCHKDYVKTDYKRAHCVDCAYEIAIEKAVLRARAKRAAKEQANV